MVGRCVGWCGVWKGKGKGAEELHSATTVPVHHLQFTTSKSQTVISTRTPPPRIQSVHRIYRYREDRMAEDPESSSSSQRHRIHMVELPIPSCMQARLEKAGKAHGKR